MSVTFISLVVCVVLRISCWLGQDPEIIPLAKQNEDTLQRILHEIPIWLKDPDFDRVIN